MSEGRFTTMTAETMTPEQKRYSLVSMTLNVARIPLPAGVEPPLK